MGWIRPTPTPYDGLAWERLPLGERAAAACRAWALDGYGAPLLVYVAYLAKIALYVGGWLAWCAATPGLGGPGTVAAWWLEPLAFQKAILWSLLFEGLGLGCGSGPLTGRYLPPVGGALYFLRPGTLRAAPWPRAPLLGGATRTWLDAALYAALVGCAVRALAAPAPGDAELVPLLGLGVALGLRDRAAWLALRPEHYLVTILCFVATDAWVAPAMAVQLALWAWAGVSKLNHHFPTVVCVMISNGPLTRVRRLREAMYVAYPDDLRPSRLATAMAHAGTALELGVPLVLGLADGGPGLVVGLVLMLVLHGFITSCIPMGVPLEWNVMVVYGGFALFWAHPGVGLGDVAPWPLAAALAALLVGLPLLGNLAPHRVSFLLAMRYYAGNWPYSAWLFRGDAVRKLERLTKPAPWVRAQVGRFYEPAVVAGLMSKVLAFRLMHLQGRALPVLLPRAAPRLEDCEYADGELVAGLALGWNFGDGHLHDERLLAAVQARCGFAPGELRCVFVEGQPLGRGALAWRIADAATGELERGTLEVAALRGVQPWQPAEGALVVRASAAPPAGAPGAGTAGT